ncbi:MAG: tRNA (N(6)-L-threonylcarbamoyladenosine(37)-C(2))-methylthiotransferase MtaB [Lachnospiraceae bacterium]|nr:tRNA (N(6)-L-threonylcarbamoyladenosine(37)-C(2))-methylthiotransferase MtaB [Lachnospiraceae bacterium]
MKSVALHNLGCKVNEYEIEIMQQNVQKAGWQIVKFSQKADIYVINTCSVTNIADRKSRQMLHKARKMNPDAIVVAVGCYAQTDTSGALGDSAVDIVIGNNNKTKLVPIIEEYLANRDRIEGTYRCIVDDLSRERQYEDMLLEDYAGRVRVDIKIQDGCDQFCSFCIIPHARGRIRSREMDSILKEITALADKGVKEVVITGIHLSSYGLDLHKDDEGRITSYNNANNKAGDEYTNEDLLEVIKNVSAIQGIERIRLGSLEPRVITRPFLERLKADKKVCPHFHLSLQSGCDETLVRMNRRYTSEEFLERVSLIREYYEHPAITTDIIVGFPGETEEEFEKTCGFVDKVRFYETHIFKYSKRRNTVAATLPGQLTEAVKAARSDILSEKNAVNSKNFRAFLLGRDVEILTEEHIEVDGKTYTVGHTVDYVMAAFEGELEINTLIVGNVYDFLKDDILMLKNKSKKCYD